jgi:hypothetical protein
MSNRSLWWLTCQKRPLPKSSVCGTLGATTCFNNNDLVAEMSLCGVPRDAIVPIRTKQRCFDGVGYATTEHLNGPLSSRPLHECCGAPIGFVLQSLLLTGHRLIVTVPVG